MGTSISPSLGGEKANLGKPPVERSGFRPGFTMGVGLCKSPFAQRTGSWPFPRIFTAPRCLGGAMFRIAFVSEKWKPCDATGGSPFELSSRYIDTSPSPFLISGNFHMLYYLFNLKKSQVVAQKPLYSEAKPILEVHETGLTSKQTTRY